MAANPQNVARSYNSFSGVDIKAVFANTAIAEIQAISYSVTREKAPLYTMGSADPRSFSRGKRGIAGTLIFLVFDAHVMLNHFGEGGKAQGKFMADADDFIPQAGSAVTSDTIAPLHYVGGEGEDFTGEATVVDMNDLTRERDIATVDADQKPMHPWFADQILPFDVTLAAANEYGSFAVMRIYGIELLNEGYGVSIDDIVSEMQHTYVARTMIGWQPVYNEVKTGELYGGAGAQNTE